MAHIFISSSQRDRVFVNHLTETLRRDGFDVWIAENIQPGEVWVDQINQAIRECSSFLFVMSVASISSEWNRNELDFARGLNKPIIPIKLESIRNSDIPTFLNSLHYADFTGEFGECYQRLVSSLRFLDTNTGRVVEKAQANSANNDLTSSNVAAAAILISESKDVPGLPTELIERPSTVKHMLGLIQQHKNILITGLGGIGKTVIASLVVNTWLKTSNMKALWIRAGNAVYEDLLKAIAYLLDSHPSALTEAQFREFCTRTKIGLLILDDARNAEAISTFLNVVPATVTVVITSRQRFTEISATVMEIHNLAENEALSLLSLVSGSDLSNDLAARELARFLDYHPLAISIAGRTLNIERQTPSILLSRLQKTPASMTLPLEFGDDNISSLLQRSIENLDAENYRVLMALGAFFVASASPTLLTIYLGIDGTQIVGNLDELFQRGLAERIPATDRTSLRYGLHNLVYRYIYALSDNTSHQRALDACLKYAKQYQVRSSENFQALRTELDNLRGATAWALANGHYSAVEDMYRSLFAENQFLTLDAQWDIAIELLEQATEAFQKRNNTQGVYSALTGLASIYTNTGELTRATITYQRALELVKQTGDVSAEATVLGNLGNLYAALADYQTAISYYQQSLMTEQKIGDRHGESLILNNLGNIYYTIGELSKALEYYEQALALQHERGDIFVEASSLGNLGNVYRGLGQLDEALSYYEKALDISRQSGDRRSEVNNLANLGNVYLNLGEMRQALEFYEQALTLQRNSSDRRGQASTLNNLGLVLQQLEQPEKALQYFEQALSIMRSIGDLLGEANVLRNIGTLYATSHQIEAAIGTFKTAKSILETVGNTEYIFQIEEMIATLVANGQLEKSNPEEIVITEPVYVSERIPVPENPEDEPTSIASDVSGANDGHDDVPPPPLNRAQMPTGDASDKLGYLVSLVEKLHEKFDAFGGIQSGPLFARSILQSAFGDPPSDQKFRANVFVIMPFREEMKPIYEDVMKPTVERAGLTIKRGDSWLYSQHNIMTEIWAALFYADIVIADCTGHNANVFYELGIAHTLGKPVVLLTQKAAEDLPFDVRTRRTIIYSDNAAGLGTLRARLEASIKEIWAGLQPSPQA